MPGDDETKKSPALGTAPYLEKRYCACECGKTFRVLSNSPNIFFNENHAYTALKGDDPYRKAKAQAFFEEVVKRTGRRGVFLNPYPKDVYYPFRNETWTKPEDESDH